MSAAAPASPGKAMAGLARLLPGDSLQGALWGMWLGCGPLILFLGAPARIPIYLYGQVDTRLETPQAKALTILVILLGLVPALATLIGSRLRPAQALPFLAIATMILFTITLSLMGTHDRADVVKPLLGLYVFGLVVLLASAETRDEAFLHNLLVGYAAMHALAAVVALIDGNFLYGRFMGRLGPNYWGSVCAYGLLAATAARHRLLFLILAAIDLFALLASQNRTAMLALIVGGALLMVLAYIRSGVAGRLWMWLMAMAGSVALLFAMPTLLSKVFMVDDPRRGLDSGGTGRAIAWKEAWALIEQHPMLGVGYRHHEQYITAASSAHQAYLATAADMGVIGLLVFLIFLLAGLCTAIHKAVVHRSRAYAALAALLLGYAMQGFAEQRAINFANSVSLMMIIAVALATRLSLPPSPRPVGGTAHA
jgi:O-antigen ligase